VLVLPVEIEAQRREVARLMNTLGERPQRATTEVDDAKSDADIVLDDRLLLRGRGLRKTLAVNASTVSLECPQCFGRRPAISSFG